jgi:hypothetical protein
MVLGWGREMPKSYILAVFAVALTGSVVAAPSSSAQQSAPATSASAPVAQTIAPGQDRTDQPVVKTQSTAGRADVPLTAPGDPQQQCVKPKEFATELRSGRNPVGAPIVLTTNFLPTNQRVDIGVRTPFVDGVRYFAGIDYGDETYLLKRQDAITHRATDSDPLVQKHLLEADQTIVTLNIGDDLAWFWSRVDLYLYTCNNPAGQSPWRVSSVGVRLSPYWLSIGAVVAEVFILYFWIAFALRRRDHTFGSFIRALNPALVSAGPDGKGSLSTFQTLIFSLAVVGLISLLLLQTGALVDLSGSILTLLGISGIGATIAKGTDGQRNTLSADNRAWLLRHNWIPMAKTVVDPSNATWRDFFTTDNVLLVTPTNISDLNDAIAGLRSDELKLKAAAITKKQGVVATLAEAIPLMGQDAYDSYIQKARNVAAIFTNATGVAIADSSLEPVVT